MNLRVIRLVEIKAREIETEIRFIIATERASGTELVCLLLNPAVIDDNERRKLDTTVHRILRTMKRERGIQAFAFTNGFDERDTDAAYLLNKYPDLDLECDNCVYVKI